MYLQTEVDALMDETKRKIQTHTSTACQDMLAVEEAVMAAVTLWTNRIKSLSERRMALIEEEEAANDELRNAIVEAKVEMLTIRKGMTSAPKPESQPKQEPEGENNVVNIAAE